MITKFLVVLYFLCGFSFSEKYKLNLNVKEFNSYSIYDGIGGLSGGGATSKLLVSYPSEYANQIYDYLFKPQFGASLPMLKVEIGGDSQSTEGTEASHSHNENDLNCFRGYEWDIIAEAKKRNPNIMLYGLPWAFPGWVGEFSGNPFKNATKCATYIINWLKCARDQHKVSIDFIGIWNEKSYTVEYIKTLRKMLDENKFTNTKIIGADMKWEISKDILSDDELRKAIYAIGCHYPGTVADISAHQTNMPLWSSEDYSTNNQEKGPGCWARILNQNFVNGNMTSTISWNLIAAYYSNLPYPYCGLMTADSPWTGSYTVSKTIWVTAHTTQFVWPGWKYMPLSSGGSGKLLKGGSFVSLISPDLENLSIILETMEHDFSVCIRPNLPPYKVENQNITLTIPSEILANVQTFYIWRSILDSNLDSQMFILEKTVKVNSTGIIELNMPPNNLVTVTTVSSGSKGVYNHSSVSAPFPDTFEDNYESYPLNREPSYLTPQFGSFEVVQDPHTIKNHVLLQTVINQPIDWCFNSEIKNMPIALIGNYERKDMNLTVSGLLRNESNASDTLMIAGRVNNSGCTTFLAGGVFYWLRFETNEIVISSDIYQNQILHRSKLTQIQLVRNTWYIISMVLQNYGGLFYLNGKLLVTLTDLGSVSPTYGFVGIGTSQYKACYYDNFYLKYL